MRPLTAQWVANATGGELAADVDAVVTSVHQDSRVVEPGSLYAAFIGERVDGHDFVHQAVAAGATLALVSQPVAAPHILVDDVAVALGLLARAYLALLRTEGDIRVIGITGSNGKTTTKDLLAQMLPDAVTPAGSLNNEIGLPLTVLRADATTRNLVLEMGASAPGDIAYLTDIAPLNIAVVLTVGAAHAGGYPNLQALAEEKASIVDGLLPGGRAILNADDSQVAAIAGRAGVRRVTTFGTSHGADIRAVNVRLETGRARFDAVVTTAETGVGGAGGSGVGNTGAVPVALGIVGEHHVTNALAAISVAIASGMSLTAAAVAASAARPLSPHRMALTEREDGVRILDDSYNASPESMRAALRALLAVAEGGRTWAVIGEMREMGEASASAHAEVGHDAVRLNVSHLVVVGAGARAAYDTAVREGSWGDEAMFVATMDEAHDLLVASLAPGDTVLVKASHGSGLWKLANLLVEGHE